MLSTTSLTKQISSSDPKSPDVVRSGSNQESSPFQIYPKHLIPPSSGPACRQNQWPLVERKFLAVAVIVLLFCLRLSLAAEVEMPKVFTNNMVLQRELPVTIWGRADSQEDVTVAFSDQTLKTTADENGQWSVTLKAMKADAIKHTLKVSGENELIFKKK